MLSILIVASYQCVACHNCECLPSQGMWLTCDRCGMDMHNCNTYPCAVCNRVYWALDAHAQEPETSKDKLIADFDQFLAENKQPELTREEKDLIRSMADLRAYWDWLDAREEARLNASPWTESETFPL